MKQKDDRPVLHLMTTGRITTNEHCDCCISTQISEKNKPSHASLFTLC